jgi:hypothetical protein
VRVSSNNKNRSNKKNGKQMNEINNKHDVDHENEDLKTQAKFSAKQMYTKIYILYFNELEILPNFFVREKN